MKKIAIVYWSGTGNTEAMANAVLEGVQAAGAEGSLLTAAEFTPDALADFDAMRLREGEKLRDDVLNRLAVIESLVSEVETAAPETVAAYRARLEQRMIVMHFARIGTRCKILRNGIHRSRTVK